MVHRQAQGRSDQIYTNLAFIKPGVCLKTSNLEVWITSQRSGRIGRGNTQKNLKKGHQAKNCSFHRSVL
jgi:hypothetical protein